MEALVPLLAALSGALIGAVSSIAAIFIQARYQAQRDRLKVISEVAIAEHEHAIQFAKGQSGARIWPLFLSVAYHAAVLRIVEQRDLTAEDIKTLTERTNALYEVVKAQSQKHTDRPHDAKATLPTNT